MWVSRRRWEKLYTEMNYLKEKVERIEDKMYSIKSNMMIYHITSSNSQEIAINRVVYMILDQLGMQIVHKKESWELREKGDPEKPK